MTSDPEIQTAAQNGDDAAPGAGTDAGADGWLIGKNGKQYVKNPGGGWPVWRKGDETPMEALARAAAGKADKPPRTRRKRQAERAGGDGAKEPPTSLSKSEQTRRIESMLAEVLQAPAIGCAMFGDEWGANHFHVQGQRFAANIARSSEFNPWLRDKLEAALEGEQNVVAIITSLSLFTGAIAYLAPPIIVYMNLPANVRTRRLLGLPEPGRPGRENGAGGEVPLSEAMDMGGAMFAQAMAAQQAAEQRVTPSDPDEPLIAEDQGPPGAAAA